MAASLLPSPSRPCCPWDFLSGFGSTGKTIVAHSDSLKYGTTAARLSHNPDLGSAIVTAHSVSPMDADQDNGTTLIRPASSTMVGLALTPSHSTILDSVMVSAHPTTSVDAGLPLANSQFAGLTLSRSHNPYVLGGLDTKTSCPPDAIASGLHGQKIISMPRSNGHHTTLPSNATGLVPHSMSSCIGYSSPLMAGLESMAAPVGPHFSTTDPNSTMGDLPTPDPGTSKSFLAALPKPSFASVLQNQIVDVPVSHIPPPRMVGDMVTVQIDEMVYRAKLEECKTNVIG